MIAFAYVHRAAVERYAERGCFSVDAILGSANGNAPALWAPWGT